MWYVGATMKEHIWVTIFPVLAINLFFLTTLLYFYFSGRYLKGTPELEGRHDSRMLNRFLKDFWYWVTWPMAATLVKLRIKPNMITFIGFMVSLSAVWFYSQGLFGYAGWTLIAGATFDIFDGRVARLTNQESRPGAFFDSVMDRFSEGLVFLGIAFYFNTGWMLGIVIMALIGSQMVSYTKARGEAIGVQCKGGAMQRPERIAYLGVASVFNPLCEYVMNTWTTWWVPAPLVIGVLILMAVMTNGTAVQRMVYIMSALDTIDLPAGSPETIPQKIIRLTSRKK